VKGAFTGAVSAHLGFVQQAEGGTLFLDEIGDTSLDIQVKLLRTLQEREVQPIGAPHPRKVNVRVVAATHRDLRAMVADGRFREDLYHRLTPLRIEVPALSARKADLPRIVFAALARHPERPRITAEALSLLASHDWPGNVRELENALTSALARSEDGLLQIDDFQQFPWGRRESILKDPARLLDGLARAGSERRLALLLDVSRTTLRRALRLFGIASAKPCRTQRSAEDVAEVRSGSLAREDDRATLGGGRRTPEGA
jgi:DNA-binding NtrC family response regulator